MSGQFFILSYGLGDKERIFDLGQAMYMAHRRVMKRGGGKVKPFTRQMRIMIRQSLAALVLAVAFLLLTKADHSPIIVVGTVLYFLLGGGLLLLRYLYRKAYSRALMKYLEDNSDGGTITVDERGITERSDKGVETHFDWEEYRCCLCCRETIVVVTTRPIMLILGYREETEQNLCEALQAFGKGDTIYRVEIKG